MNQQQQKTPMFQKILIGTFLFWFLFGGGYTMLRTGLTATNARKITQTIGQGAQRLGSLANAATTIALPPTSGKPTTTTGDRHKDITLPKPPAKGAGYTGGAGRADKPGATVAPTATAGPPTAVPSPTPGAIASAGSAAPAGAAVPAAMGYAVPAGAHTEINPDGSFTVEHGNLRYYPNSAGVITEVRMVDRNFEPAIVQEGAPPEQKIFLDPNDAEDAAAIAKIPTATPSSITPCAARHGCPKP